MRVKARQMLLLFLALLLPVVIFLFLKGFGKNEFNVPPMFSDDVPSRSPQCTGDLVFPYIISQTELQENGISVDSLACVSFADQRGNDPLSRVKNQYNSYPIGFFNVDQSNIQKKECVFFLQEPFDVALVDSKGRIRGQYNSSRRDEIDRLITEIAIIFKKY